MACHASYALTADPHHGTVRAMPARTLILALLAASLSACGGPRAKPDAAAPSGATPWFCQTKGQESWDCVQDTEVAVRPKQPATPVTPAPAADPPQSEPPPAAPNTPTMAQPATEASSDPVSAGPDGRPAYQSLAFEPDRPMKLTDLPPDYYAVQVVALKSQQAVEAWVRDRELTGMSVARIAKDDEILFVVLLGVYPDRASAERAVDERPPPLRDLTPWVRKLASLQAAIRAAAPAD